MEKFFKKYHQLFFFGIAVLLLYPTFGSGYVFLLDWMVMPNVSWADIRWQIDPLTTIGGRIISILLSFAVWQRLFLFSIIMALGLGGFRLAKRTGNLWAQYFSGLFLIFNSFIYARLIEQPGIAAGSAAFFWFLVYLLEYMEGKKMRDMVKASLCSGLAVSFFPHSVFFVGLSLVIFMGTDFFRRRDGRFLGKSVIVVLSAILILNGNWLVSSFLGEMGSRTQVIGNFSLKDAEAFATRDIGNHSVYLTVLALQGYWGEYQDRFVSVQENPLWSSAWLLLSALAIFGAIKSWRKNSCIFPLIIMFASAFILAIGVASPLTKPLIVWFYQNMPFYIGLREPQKWVAVMVFAYAYLGGWGIKYLMESIKIREYRHGTGIICVMLPIVFSFSIIRGIHQHVMPHQFPSQWQEAKPYVDEPAIRKVLFFPWHSYLKLDFAGKNITNQAQAYWGPKIIQGNNTEVGDVYSHSKDQETLTIEKYALRQAGSAAVDYGTFLADMRTMDIGLIMLAKTDDWQDYLWLDRIGIEKVLENSQLIIYKLP